MFDLVRGLWLSHPRKERLLFSIRRQSNPTERCRTGDLCLGGESAGHLFFAEPGFEFDDAMLATAKMLSLLSRTDYSLSQLVGQLPQYYLSQEYRLYCPDDQKVAVVDDVKSRFSGPEYETEDMDGVKVYFGDGWGLFRSSNTQPAVTLRCEAKTPSRLVEIEQTMLSTITEILRRFGIAVSSEYH